MEQHNVQPETPQPQQPVGKDQKKLMLWIIIGLAVAVVGLAVWFIVASTTQKKALEEAVALKEQAELDMAQKELQNDYDALNNEFAIFENSRQLVIDDSVKMALTQKYETARLQIEKLNQELKNQKNKSAREIKKLKDEITTLRNLLRHYVEEINRLNQENQQLRDENAQIKGRNEELSSRVQETARRNEVLSERMTLAEKLNVTGVNLTALNKKGKKEKKVKKAAQLMVTFTIPQNNSTPVGEKTIYLRIVSPSGQLLGGGGSFSFEGASLACSAKKVVEYAGEEIAGVTIYWDVNTALTAGTYTVELFADNYRLASRSFELN
ncbi:MAG: hypothetical protein HFJ87_04405 [Muribaculaceae bacterium]|nr:hypothetical protein [Muribaculaceae bacterium]